MQPCDTDFPPIITRMDRGQYQLVTQQCFKQSVEQVFAFFCDAGNLQRITPAWVGFRVLTPQPIAMQVGTLIDYRIHIHHVPVRWRTRITQWNPPHQFVDIQERGPYRLWQHTHTFTPHGQGTLVRDEVVYRPFGGAIINTLFVQRDVRRIFAHRRQVLSEIFPQS